MVGLTIQRADVAGLHALDPLAVGDPSAAPIEPCVWWCRPTDSAVVLGSRQDESILDLARCRAAGLHVAHRRSGGGLVLVSRHDTIWADMVLPHGVAPDDVRGAMVWAGERWREALLGARPELAGRLEVHDGGMIDSAWSALLCFAGLGPGEVLLDGVKLVGLSQRRNRLGIRIQGMLRRHVADVELSTLLVGSLPASPIPPVAVLDVVAGDLVSRLVTSLAEAVSSSGRQGVAPLSFARSARNRDESS